MPKAIVQLAIINLETFIFLAKDKAKFDFPTPVGPEIIIIGVSSLKQSS